MGDSSLALTLNFVDGGDSKFVSSSLKGGNLIGIISWPTPKII